MNHSAPPKPAVVRWIVLVACMFALLAGAAQAETQFPLKVSASGRFLEDATGQPFLITGDAAWSAIADLSAEDMTAYLDDRHAKGFNTILVSLIEHQFSRHAPRNVYGDAPFENSDFAKPNDVYFARARAFVEKANRRGMLVLLAPAYLGIGCGGQGWCEAMRASGPDTLNAYGRYLAHQFAGLQNIIWLHGGDADPPETWLVETIVSGLKAGGATGLQSFHGARDGSPRDVFPMADWLDIDTLYTYEGIRPAALKRYARMPTKPFILVETHYEGERGVTAQAVRASAYEALLAGAAGQIYGNNPVWHFGSSGIESSPLTWQQALNSEGAGSIGQLAKLFRRLPWWQLQPGESAGVAEATTADKSLAVVYTTSRMEVASPLEGAETEATWFDPVNGKLQPAKSEPDQKGTYATPGTNAGGGTDWLLILGPYPKEVGR